MTWKNAGYDLLQILMIVVLLGLIYFGGLQMFYLVLAYVIIRTYFYLLPSSGETIIPAACPGKALIVVDVQEALTDKMTELEKKEWIHQINQITDHAQSRGYKIIRVKHEFKAVDGIFALLQGGGRLLKGQAGVNECEQLNQNAEAVFTKSQQDAFSSRQLEVWLKSNHIGTVALCGTGALESLMKSAESAQKRGYRVEIFKDAVTAKNEKQLSKAMQHYEKKGIKLIQMINDRAYQYNE